MRARRHRRLSRGAIIAIEAAVFIALFAAVLAGLGYARGRLDGVVGHLQEQISIQVADRLGAQVRYGSVAPSALRTLQVSDLELFTEAGERLLSVRRMRVHYSLRTLLSTRSAVAAVNRVELTGVAADLHLPRDRVPVLAALGGIAAATDGGVQTGVLPWPLVISDARVTVTVGSDRVELEELSVRLEPDRQPDGPGVRLVDGQARLSAVLANVAGHATELRTRVRVDGSVGPGQTGVQAVVQVADVESTLGTLAARDIQAVWDGKAIRLTTWEDQTRSALSLMIEPDPGMLRFDLQAEELRPVDLFRPSGPLEDLLPWFDTTLSGTATFVASTGSAEAVSYEATINFVVASLGSFTELLDGPVDVELTVQGDATTATVTRLALRTADGAAEFDGTIDIATGFASGRLTVADLNLDGRPIHASAEVQGELQASRLMLRDGVLEFGDVTASGVTGLIAVTGRATEDGAGSMTPSLQVELTGTLPQSQGGRTEVTGSVTLGTRPAFAGRIHVEDTSAGVLYRLLQSPDQRDPQTADLADGLVVSAQLNGAVGPDLLAFDIASASVVQVDGPMSARFSAVASRQSLRVADLDLVIDDSTRAVGSAEVDAERLSFVGSVNLNGEEVPGTIRLEAGDGLTVHGPYDLVLEMWPGEALRPADVLPLITGAEDGTVMPFRLSAEAYPIAAMGEHVTVDAAFAGTVLRPRMLLDGFGPGADLDLAGAGVELSDSRLVVRDLPIGKIPNRLELEFDYAGEVLTASLLRFANDELNLSGNGVLKVTTRDGLRASGELLLETGQERYDATIAITPDRLDLDVDVQGLRLNRFVTLPISATASGRVRVTGSMAQPVISAELTAYVPLNEDHVTLALASTYDGQRVTVDDLALDFRDHRIRGVAGRIDTSTGTVALAGRYEGEYLGQPVSLDLTVTGTASFPPDPVFERSLPVEATLTVAATGVTVGDLSKRPWDATVRWQDGGLAFAGGPLDGLSGRLSPDGSFDVVVSAPLPLQGTASGTLTGTELTAELSITALDLTLINDLIQTSAVSVLAGSATGTVLIHGPIRDPDIDGVVHATGVIVESPLIPPRVGPLAFPVVAEGKELTLGRTRPESGIAPLEVNGTVHFGQWAPIAYDFSVQTATADGVPVDYRFGPISVDGIARGRLRISGDQEGTYIEGAVEADAAQIFIDRTGRGSPPAWKPLIVDLEATTGRGVELTWPSEDFPILHTIFDAGQTVAIRYDGFTGGYSVVGDVEVLRGDLFFINRTFYLRDGLVSFAEDEGRFDPMVTVRAETRERTPDDETVRIHLDAESPLSMLGPETMRLSSDPPRPAPELRAMLGAPFGNGTAGEDVDLLVMAGGMVSQFGMVRPMERALRESLGLDLFSIRSDLVENLLRTPLGVSRLDVLDNTEIVVGKYLSDDLFLEALVRVESDTVSPVPELRTDLELSLEWATPFFLLEWSLLPSLIDPFQTANAVSLSWRFDY